MLKITECPTCGSDRIRQVRRSWTGAWKSLPYRVPNLRFYECPACGERLFDPAAMRKIEAHRPRDPKAERQSRGWTLAQCPSCGTNKIRKCRRDWKGTFKGEPYLVPDLEFHKCPACREEFFDRGAVRRIAMYSLAFGEVCSAR